MQTFLNNYTTLDEKHTHSNVIFSLCYKQLQDMSITSPDRITLLEKFYIRFAQTDVQIVRLKDWLMDEDATLTNR